MWLKDSLGTENMIPVFGKFLDSKYDIFIQSIILPVSDIDRYMEKDTYDFVNCTPCVAIFGDIEDKYLSWGNNEGVEPLVISRKFDGLQDDYLEIV